MKLTILNIAYPFAPVGPDAVGGAEQILSQIDFALVKQGHRSIVIACEGSQTAGHLIETPRTTGMITEAARHRIHQRIKSAIQQALNQWAVDVLHFHGVDCHAYLPSDGPPALVTLHCPPSFYKPTIFEAWRHNYFIHCVSAVQRKSCPPGPHYLAEIPNGVPDDLGRVRQAKCSFTIALGRICPEKNFHVAIEAAKQANVPLLLAGETFPYFAHQNYFTEEILSRLDTLRRYIGPVGFVRKRRLLSSALCMLMPSLAAETSSLVSMEALACGTPVIAFSSGALPEIIEHGKTGFIVSDQAEMAEAIQAIESIDPELCRKTARKRFPAKRMITRYFDVYMQLCRKETSTYA